MNELGLLSLLKGLRLCVRALVSGAGVGRVRVVEVRVELELDISLLTSS